MTGIDDFHAELARKRHKYTRPCIEDTPPRSEGHVGGASMRAWTTAP